MTDRNQEKRRRPGRLYPGVLTILVVAVVAVAASALYVSAGGEVLGWTGAAFGIRERPDSTEVALRRAREAAWGSRYGEALAAYDTVLSWSPGDRDVVLERAKVLGWSERYGEAADALAAVEDTADAETTLERARYLWWAGRGREADSLLSVLLTRRPDAREARELQDLVRPSVEPAVSVARRWVRERPDDHFSHLWLARALVQEGRGAEALRHYRTAFGRAGSAEPEVLMEAAGVALGADSLRFAAETLSRYLHDVDPSDLDTRLRLARAFSWSGRYAEAESQYHQVLDGDPSVSVRLELARMLASAGRATDAIVEYRVVLAESPSRQVRRELAASMARAGRYRQSIAEYARLVGEAPTTGDRVELARVLALAEDYGEAADVLATVASDSPPDRALDLRRARYLWWAGRLKEADAVLSTLLENEPGADEARVLRDEIRQGIDPSVALAREWVALDDTPRNRLRLARALVKAERPAEALRHYRPSLDEQADRELVLEVVGVAEAGDSLALATALLEGQMASAGVDDTELTLRLARLYGWADRPGDAAAMFGRYLAARPGDSDARLERARQLAWQDSSHWAEARTELDRVVREDSLNAPAYKLLGDLSRWEGDAAAALRHYSRARDLEPELEGVDEGIRLATAKLEAEQAAVDATRIAWAVEASGFSDSQGFDWVHTRARRHWRVGGTRLSVEVGQGYSGGRTLLGAEMGSLGVTAGLFARRSLSERWTGLLEVGTASFEDADLFVTWGTGVEYQDSLSSAQVRYRREPAVREAATLAALRAGVVLDRLRFAGTRRAGAWAGAADLQVQRFGADAGDATRFALMARADRQAGRGLTLGAMIRAIAADGSAPALADLGPLYWTPRSYIAPALTIGYGQPLGSGWWVGVRAAPGYAWIDERDSGVVRYRDGQTPILEAGASLGYRRGPWSVDVSGDWGGNLDQNTYHASALSVTVSRSGGAR